MPTSSGSDASSTSSAADAVTGSTSSAGLICHNRLAVEPLKPTAVESVFVTDDDPEAGGIFAGYSGRMLAVLTLGMGAGMAGRAAIPAMLPTIITAYGITPSIAGLALSALIAGIALLQFVGGRLSDQTSRKTVLVAGVVLIAVGFAFLAVAPVFGVFLVGTAVVGIGQGLYLPATFAQISALFTARRGQAFGINSAAFTLGSAVGPGLAIAALAVDRFRLAYVPVVMVLGVVALLLHLQSQEPYVTGVPVLDVRETATRLVASAPIRRSLVTFAVVGFLWQGAVNFVPTLLQVDHGFSAGLAGMVFAALFVVGTAANLVAGNLGDRFGAPVVAFVGLAVGLFGILVLLWARADWLVALGVLTFGFGVSAFWPVMDAFVMAQLPAETAGGDFGALNTMNLAAGSLGPVYVGVVAERTSYRTAFAGFLIPFLLGLVILWRLRRDHHAG